MNLSRLRRPLFRDEQVKSLTKRKKTIYDSIFDKKKGSNVVYLEGAAYADDINIIEAVK